MAYLRDGVLGRGGVVTIGEWRSSTSRATPDRPDSETLEITALDHGHGCTKTKFYLVYMSAVGSNAMPRRALKGSRPDWGRLYGAAAPQAGYLTLAQTAEAGYSSPLVEHHVKTGRLERVARGIFRLTHFPPSDNEDLVVFWLWSARKGVFSHDTALALHELSDALPAKVHLTVPTDWRRRRLRVPRGLILHHGDIDSAEITWKGPVPVTAPLRTVVDVTADGDPGLAAQAAAQSIKRRMFSRQDLRREVARRAASGETER